MVGRQESIGQMSGGDMGDPGRRPRPPAKATDVSVGWWYVLVLPAVVLMGWRGWSRLMADAKVGRTAPWQHDERLVQSFADRQVTARDEGRDVRVLKRHARLPAFLIELILNLDLTSYELSPTEERAVRMALLDTAPNSAKDTVVLRRHLVKLVWYGNRIALWDVQKPKELFKPAHLTQFVIWYHDQLTDHMYNEARSALVAAGNRLYKGERYRDLPLGKHVEWKAPAGEDVVATQWAEALDYPEPEVRFVLLALICLARGGGLRAGDLKVVHGTDVVQRRRRTFVLVDDGDHVREVVVLRRYAGPLRFIAKLVGTNRILEGAIGDDGVMEYARKLAKHWDEAAVPFPVIDSLANAYFLELAQRRVRIARLFQVMRGNNLRGFEDLRPYMEPDAGEVLDDLEGLEDNGIAYFVPAPLQGHR